MLQEIRTCYPDILLLAAVATLEEALLAQNPGYDGITTAMYGHTPESEGKHLIDDDYAHLKTLCHAITLPVLAEGGINTPEQAACALRCSQHRCRWGYNETTKYHASLREWIVSVEILNESDCRQAGHNNQRKREFRIRVFTLHPAQRIKYTTFLPRHILTRRG